MGATFQPISWQVRAGPEHESWEKGDPATVCCTCSPEWDANDVYGAHLYGVCSWYGEDHAAMMDIVRETKRMGFRWCRWERIDPETRVTRKVRLPKTGYWEPLALAERVGEFRMPGAE